MDQWLDKLVDATVVASDDTDIKNILGRMTAALGFENYAYLNLRANRSYAVSNYPVEWQERYFRKSYTTIDPVITMAKRQMKTFAWDGKLAGRRLPKQLQAFHSEAGEFGIRSGISIPVRTGFGHMAMLTLASSAPAASYDEVDPVFAAAAVAQLHARFVFGETTPTSSKPVRLKPEELLCLRWAAEGKSMRMIAQIEGIAFGNVRFFVENAKNALDAVSLPQATALAKELRLI